MLYSTCNFLQKITLNSFSNYEVYGKENVPPVGPLIVVSNHLSNIDPSILAVSVPRRLKFLAKSSLFTGPFISSLLKWYGAHPLHRDRVDVSSFKWAVNHLHKDGVISIFPEGTRTTQGEDKQYKPGVVALYKRFNIPIIPMALNSGRYWGKNSLLKNKGKIIFQFLPPIKTKLSRDQFMIELKNCIQNASQNL